MVHVRIVLLYNTLPLVTLLMALLSLCNCNRNTCDGPAANSVLPITDQPVAFKFLPTAAYHREVNSDKTRGPVLLGLQLRHSLSGKVARGKLVRKYHYNPCSLVHFGLQFESSGFHKANTNTSHQILNPS